MDNLYKTLCASKIDYVTLMKEYINTNKKIIKLKELEFRLDMNENEKLLMYFFIDNIVIKKRLFIRKCKICMFEWFSIGKHTKYCDKCR